MSKRKLVPIKFVFDFVVLRALQVGALKTMGGLKETLRARKSFKSLLKDRGLKQYRELMGQVLKRSATGKAPEEFEADHKKTLSDVLPQRCLSVRVPICPSPGALPLPSRFSSASEFLVTKHSESQRA